MGPPPSNVGPGLAAPEQWAQTGVIAWTAAPGCGSSSLFQGSVIEAYGGLVSLGNITALPFSVNYNNTNQPQQVTVRVNGVSTVVTQDAATVMRPNISSFSPWSGSYSSQAFTTQVTATGYNDSSQVDTAFISTDSASQCHVYVNPAGGAFHATLLSDSGSPLGPITIPSSSTLSNSSCTLNGARSSSSISGNVWSIRLGLSFAPAFQGTKYIQTTAASMGLSATETSGIWNVPATPSLPPTSVGVFRNGCWYMDLSGTGTYNASQSEQSCPS